MNFAFTLLNVHESSGLHVSGGQFIALPLSGYYYIFLTHFSSQIPTVILCSRRRKQSIWIFTTRCRRKSRTSRPWLPPLNSRSMVFIPVVQLYRRTPRGKKSSLIGLQVLMVGLSILLQVKLLSFIPFFFIYIYISLESF